MPYHVSKKGSQYCVIKDDDGESMGCHKTRQEANEQIKALYAQEGESNAVEPIANSGSGNSTLVYAADTGNWTLQISPATAYATNANETIVTLQEELENDNPPVVRLNTGERHWSGPIVFENETTGDGRTFMPGAIYWSDEVMPVPFRWCRSDSGGHDNAVTIGRVDRLWREGTTIFAEGVVFCGDKAPAEAIEYANLLEQGAAGGVSVDGDDPVVEYVILNEATDDSMMLSVDDMRQVYHRMRLRSLTAVDIPAFINAKISFTDQNGSPPIVAANEENEEMTPEPVVAATGWRAEDALTASGIPIKPPAEWFDDNNPPFSGPTPLTITNEGRVYGHLALFDTCHIGFPERECVTPPRGNTYNFFHVGCVETAGGETVDVGHLTFGTGHASMTDSPRAAMAHYDDTGMVAADVRAGEDEYGVWVRGALRPTLTDEQIREFRAAPLSGDWRRIAGRLELVAALAVNTPGFPVPRSRVLVASGEPQAIIQPKPEIIKSIKAEKFNQARKALQNRMAKLELARKMEV